jgi:hypothetical protein
MRQGKNTKPKVPTFATVAVVPLGEPKLRNATSKKIIFLDLPMLVIFLNSLNDFNSLC